MTRSRRWSAPAVLASLAIIVGACSAPAATQGPSASAPPASSAPASQSAEPFTGMVYPESGEAPCGQADAPDAEHGKYTGNIKKIEATAANTVVFTLCASDVAFLSKVAFSAYAINDTAWLESKIDPSKPDNQAIVSEINGTGPYKLGAWNRGQDITLEANAEYWGEKAPAQTVIVRWSTQAAQRLLELQSGTVDGIDSVGGTDFATVSNDPNLQLKVREGLNTLYYGFNNKFEPFNDPKVRQAIALAIDRSRIVENFSPEGSEVATHFTPCSIPNGCTGDAWHEYDPTRAKELLTEAGFPNGFATKIQYRDVSRSYANDQNVLAQDLQTQLKNNLNIDATIEVQESGTFLDNADAGKLDGIHILGWGADYPDITNFLDYHFGSGSSAQFGDQYESIVTQLTQGAAGKNDAEREPFYVAANNAIRTEIPMIPIAHQASAVAYRADVQNAHASPLGNEQFAAMTPGDRAQFVWMQNAEPPGLYCADESDGEALRVCEQMLEGLYAYEVGGTAAEPALATECAPNENLDVWTCTLRDGVTFHDGATFDANDVVLTYAVQWDADHELHKGRDNSFTYFPALWGGFLNPPAPEP